MNTFLISELKPGIMFSEPVYIDEDTLLVPANVKVTEKDLDRLKRWKIETLSSAGVIVSDNAVLTKDVNNPLSNLSFQNPAQRHLMDSYTKWSSKIEQVFDLVTKQAVVEREGILQVISEMSQTLQNNRDEMIQFILYGVQGGFGIIGNALNGTVMAMLMGTEMNFLAHKLQQLAIAALLRDIGMVKIPKDIREKHGSLEKQELQLIKTHPLHTYKILTKDLGFSDEVATTSMQHHERWDGKGYPRSIKAKEISLPARIVSIADAFEAMVSERPYRDSLIGYAAVRNILGDNGRRFDPEVVKVFIRTFGIYPIGSIVLLSDASIGRVTKNHPEVPLRPQVKIMIGPDGKQFLKDEGIEIDLKDQKSVFIARAVNPKEVSSQPT
jgi:HD-GYP domain-containing protein (c-di-GMP phosphodiesterase class II)